MGFPHLCKHLPYGIWETHITMEKSQFFMGKLAVEMTFSCFFPAFSMIIPSDPHASAFKGPFFKSYVSHYPSVREGFHNFLYPKVDCLYSHFNGKSFENGKINGLFHLYWKILLKNG